MIIQNSHAHKRKYFQSNFLHSVLYNSFIRSQFYLIWKYFQSIWVCPVTLTSWSVAERLEVELSFPVYKLSYVALVCFDEMNIKW